MVLYVARTFLPRIIAGATEQLAMLKEQFVNAKVGRNLDLMLKFSPYC